LEKLKHRLYNKHPKTLFKKGYEMVESKENENGCYCECCHCKKIFMLLVLLMLAFITGIMVGNCQSTYVYPDIYSYQATTQPTQIKIKKFHRGTSQNNSTTNTTNQAVPNAQLGGFIVVEPKN